MRKIFPSIKCYNLFNSIILCCSARIIIGRKSTVYFSYNPIKIKKMYICYSKKIKRNNLHMIDHKTFMARAIELSEQSVKNGGGPFGAVIVKEGKIVAEGFNQVTKNNDPTAHAEVTAIRNASSILNTFDLSGCVIYTSCEPCPMCLGAIYWAGIEKMFYGNTKQNAAAIGFDDDFIYKEIERPVSKRKLNSEQLMNEEALNAFRLWSDLENKIEY